MPKFPLNPKESIIFVEAVLKGKRGTRALTLALDTGATMTTIPKEIAVMIGCDPLKSKKRIGIITASGTEYVSIISIPEVQCMGFVLKNVEAACLDLPPQSVVGGLLGLNILRNFKLTLDFPKDALEITK